MNDKQKTCLALFRAWQMKLKEARRYDEKYTKAFLELTDDEVDEVKRATER